MQIDRSKIKTPRTSGLAREVSSLTSQCIGCPGCRGLCQALIDVLVVPRTVRVKQASR